MHSKLRNDLEEFQKESTRFSLNLIGRELQKGFEKVDERFMQMKNGRRIPKNFNLLSITAFIHSSRILRPDASKGFKRKFARSGSVPRIMGR